MTNGLKDEEIRRDVVRLMQEGTPYASYKKTIVGKILVKILDPIQLKQEEVILEGDGEKSIINVWSPAEDTYLRRNNKFHLEKGQLVQTIEPKYEMDTTNSISDKEVEEILLQSFLTLKKRLGTFTSTAPLQRFLLRAEQMNRPVKTIEYIKSLLSAMESDGVQPKSLDTIDVVEVRL